MVFKMISRHWQTCLNGSLAANASVIWWMRRGWSHIPGIQFPCDSFGFLFGSNSFLALCFIYYSLPSFFRSRLNPGWAREGQLSLPVPPIPAASKEGAAAKRGQTEMRTAPERHRYIEEQRKEEIKIEKKRSQQCTSVHNAPFRDENAQGCIVSRGQRS